jgi:NhaP-type Na+/H+ or K+/H+ antiporter
MASRADAPRDPEPTDGDTVPIEITDPRWFVLAGLVFVAVALGGSILKRLPVTTAVIYLGIGAAIGPLGLGLITLDPVEDAGLLELLTELAVIVSLFTAGLKLRDPLGDRRWRAPFRLASVSMTLTVALVARVGSVGLGLPIGAAVLLGAVLAPTDPVLASDVQVTKPGDRDDLRFTLTGEAGLNDGTAFPFVMLGLGLLGLHELGDLGLRWVAVDVVWAVVGGLAIGGVLGTIVTRIVLWLRATHREGVGLDEFLCLGLIGVAYGLALLLSTYAFLAVFAAGLAVRRIERVTTEEQGLDEGRALAMSVDGDPEEREVDPVEAPAVIATELLRFNERLERIGEVAIVVIIGALLSTTAFPVELVWFGPLLFLVLRPIAVAVGLIGSGIRPPSTVLIGWFGIRGIGSLYYLSYAIVHGVEGADAERLFGIALWIVAISIVVHGISVTPIMTRYESWRSGRGARVHSAGGEARSA